MPRAEGDVVIEVIRITATATALLRCRPIPCRTVGVAMLLLVLALLLVPRRLALTCTIRAAVEHLQLAGHDLGGIAILTILPLPFARAQAAFDIHLRAFFQVFAGDLGQTIEKYHPMPLGTLLHLPALLVLPGFAGGDIHIRDGVAARHETGFRVSAQVANQDYLVNASCHSAAS